MHAYVKFTSREGENSGLLDLAEGHVERAQQSFELALEASQNETIHWTCRPEYCITGLELLH